MIMQNLMLYYTTYVLNFKCSPNGICIKEHDRRCKGHVVWISVSATWPLPLIVPILSVTCAVWPRKVKQL